ncbi:class I SAM-dependent methyltransferase [Streptomyces sp. Z26]|uniref:class I SAM-dependent methyltransferase n=1 Tax=Streptomyces sp. Z26 TaxID=2500177 RepID=UPI000EF15369|nr:class I SAM-dependent methyltransferase [Streptomyces sp. Z26]RLL66025.1 class I SAM-dependent methyltransferase [Streptomyces sp. Z26]
MTHVPPHTDHPGHPHHHPGHDHGGHQDHHHHADQDPQDQDQVEILDLDAEVLAEHIADITDWLPLAAPPRRVVDLGCGTGTGTFALLARYPEAHVTAVDSSPVHLRRLRERADAQGLGERVRTVEADLDATWPDLGAPDLVWASASMHHMADPPRALRAVRELLAPGGLFAVVELDGFPRFLPADAPADRPGLEERLHEVSDRLHAEHLSHRGADWGPLLTAAGFDVEGSRTVRVDIDGSGNEVIGRYALGGLRRLRAGVADALPAEDLAALDRLLDTDSPYGLLRRDDLTVRTERAVWAARRP